MKYISILGVEILQVVDKNFIFDITKDEKIILEEKRSYRMLVEFYALYYRVVFCVDFVEYVSVNHRLKRQILSYSEDMNRT